MHTMLAEEALLRLEFNWKIGEKVKVQIVSDSILEKEMDVSSEKREYMACLEKKLQTLNLSLIQGFDRIFSKSEYQILGTK